MEKSKLIHNILGLLALLGMIFLGWLAGHILRHSNPEYQYRHPLTPEIDSQIKNGYQFEFEGIRRMATLTGNPVSRVFTSEGSTDLGEVSVEQCVGITYYTSLPAKCRSVDGRLMRVGEGQREMILIPGGELGE